MHITVFGATGRTGRALVPAALAADHDVTAFVRRSGHDLAPHPRLRIVRGDVLAPDTIGPALAGSDAAVVLLGRPARRAGRLRSDGTRNVVAAMRSHGPSRLVVLATFGYGDGAAMLRRAPWAFRRIVAPVVLGDTLADHHRQEQAVRASDLDWTIVRTGTLTDGPSTRLRTDIDRTDVAPGPVPRTALAPLLLELATSGRDARATLSVGPAPDHDGHRTEAR